MRPQLPFNSLLLLASTAFEVKAFALPEPVAELQLDKRAGSTCTTKVTATKYIPYTVTVSSTCDAGVTVTQIVTETDSVTETESFTETQSVFITNTLTTTDTVSTTVVTTATSTKVVTSSIITTYTPGPAPDYSCGNKGYVAAVYNISYTAAATTNDLGVYKTSLPYAATQVPSPFKVDRTLIATQVLGIPIQGASDSYALNVHGFYYAAATATYTFQLAYGDDLATLWLGEKAKSGWNRSNADAITTGASNPAWVEVTVALVAGQYFPWRIFVENIGGAGGAVLNVGRGGSWLLNDVSVSAPCNSFLESPFPDFGSET
ncbi:hypothetical protein AA313_de0208463 [Arthrobotrys entomopaga]|nr:hypothetical protein AA313_de0208463 [Arthrobotrys entomopaga]